MKKIVPLLVTANLLACTCIAQSYIEPVLGYQLDMNQNGFRQINSTIQFSFTKSKHYEFILGLQRGWPLPLAFHNDSAFTANPALPLSVAAQKTILPGSFSFFIGHRIVLAGAMGRNKFSLLINMGLTQQKIKVSYQYDKGNYAVLNPGISQDRTSVFISGGAEFMRVLKNGRLFFQLNFCSEPAGRQIKYPSSFTFMAPLNINAGYSIPIKKTSK